MPKIRSENFHQKTRSKRLDERMKILQDLKSSYKAEFLHGGLAFLQDYDQDYKRGFLATRSLVEQNLNQKIQEIKLMEVNQ